MALLYSAQTAQLVWANTFLRAYLPSVTPVDVYTSLPTVQCPIETEFWAVKDEVDNLPFLTTDPEQLKALTEKSYYNPDLAPQSFWVSSYYHLYYSHCCMFFQ